MAIRVQWEENGPFAICDTPAEAMELLRSARSAANNGRVREKPPTSRVPPIDTKLAEFAQTLSDKARAVLTAIVSEESGRSSESLIETTGMEAAGVGGILGSISKNASRFGFKLEDFVGIEARTDGRWFTPGKVLLENQEKLL